MTLAAADCGGDEDPGPSEPTATRTFATVPEDPARSDTVRGRWIAGPLDLSTLDLTNLPEPNVRADRDGILTVIR